MVKREDTLTTTDRAAAAAALWEAIYLLIDVREDLSGSPGVPIVLGIGVAAWEERLVRAERTFEEVLDTLAAARRHGADLRISFDDRALCLLPADLPPWFRGWHIYRCARMTISGAWVEALRVEHACRSALRHLGDTDPSAVWYDAGSERRTSRIDRSSSRRRAGVARVYTAG